MRHNGCGDSQSPHTHRDCGGCPCWSKPVQRCTKDYSIVPSSISPNSSAPTVASISGFPSSTRKNNAWPFGCLQVRSQQRSASVPRGDEQEADDVSYCNDSTHSCPIATLNSTKSVRGGVMVLPSLPPMMAFLGAKRSSLCTILL